ncbi:MAG TPA: bifunctional shikimate kinase/3-dehydroquinate synthase [Gaiella sp.]|uniref:bifunctional shikimate kinase/3-dehydroquinate synthase n=1 Tax=Gaiella sp. TaxID=2663207 RepID=UPI002D7E4F4B|nr:bifunctional shikimate kinase/3-dehydroquinate synthase [Gaiella sp.]HET9288058.1 bifunctional shikimate kinase/3-dehydroquinate synthase [Gaiella sp.]
MRPLDALGRHLALAGFMGSGKTSAGKAVAARLGRHFVDLDQEVEERAGAAIAELFATRGEAGFREVEEEVARDVLRGGDPAVVALGGGAVLSERTRGDLAARAFTVFLDVDPDVAWQRVAGTERPLARSAEAFHALHRDRQPLYEEVADAHADDVDGILLAAAGVHVALGAIDELGELVPGDGPVELVADTHVSGIHGIRAQVALGARDVAQHEVPAGEAAKTPAVLERLWSALTIGRDGSIVALGGGSTTDVVGLTAATHMRGVPWTAVPTTLVGQVDAGIGGKTAIDLPGAKNAVGAFHWPARVVCDPSLLSTLPEEERVNGLAEVVKTGLLAGRPLWELDEPDQVRACAAFKSGLCLQDPYDRGPRTQLNLGHTFAHALEAAAGYALSHGRAVALGLLAALELSGLAEEARTVREVLAPERARVDRDAAWAALARDKKAERGTPRLVLLDAPGRPRWGVELAEADVRRALDALIR